MNTLQHLIIKVMLFAENKIGTSSQMKKRPQIMILFTHIHHMSNMTEFAHVWLGTVYPKTINNNRHILKTRIKMPTFKQIVKENMCHFKQ